MQDRKKIMNKNSISLQNARSNSQNLGNTHAAMTQRFATKSLNKMVFAKLFGNAD